MSRGYVVNENAHLASADLGDRHGEDTSEWIERKGIEGRMRSEGRGDDWGGRVFNLVHSISHGEILSSDPRRAVTSPDDILSHLACGFTQDKHADVLAHV